MFNILSQLGQVTETGKIANDSWLKNVKPLNIGIS